MSRVNVQAFAPMKNIPVKSKVKKVLVAAAGGNGGEKPPINNKLPKLNILKDLSKLNNHPINQNLKNIFKKFSK